MRLTGTDAEHTPKEIKELKETRARDESAPPVIRKIHKGRKSDTDLRDTEQIPLLEDGGIDAFLRREVLPHVADACYDGESVRIGYEISFTRYFYKPQPPRTLEEIRSDILAWEGETEGLSAQIVGGAGSSMS